MRCVPPSVQDFLYVSRYLAAGGFPILAMDEQLVVARVSVPYMGANRKVDSRRIEPLGRR